MILEEYAMSYQAINGISGNDYEKGSNPVQKLKKFLNRYTNVVGQIATGKSVNSIFADYFKPSGASDATAASQF